MGKGKQKIIGMEILAKFIDQQIGVETDPFSNVDNQLYNLVENEPGGFDLVLKLAEISFFQAELLTALTARKESIKPDQKARVRRLIFFILKHQGDYGIRSTIYALLLLSCFWEPADYGIGLHYLKSDSPRVACMALNLLQKMDYKNLNKILKKMAMHAEPLVRQSVADCIEDGLIFDLWPVLESLALDPDSKVRAVARSAKRTLKNLGFEQSEGPR